jgi:transcriptional regulator with XRE-family HTH domain
LAQLAEAVGTSKTNVHAWEAAEHLPKTSVLEPLARALGVSYEDVFAAAGYSHPEGLPEPALYLRAKFRDLPEAAVAEAEQFFADLTSRYDDTTEDGDAKPGH